MFVYLSESVPPVAADLYASTPQLSSPVTTPTASSSVGSEWLQPGYAPGTSACARQGRALPSSCDGCRCLLHRCSHRLPALHAGSGVAGRAASAVRLVIAANKKNKLFKRSVECRNKRSGVTCNITELIGKCKASYLCWNRQGRCRRRALVQMGRW